MSKHTGEPPFILNFSPIFLVHLNQIKTVLPEDVEQLKINPNEDYVTLVTCTPYMLNTHRLLVRGTRVEFTGYPEEKEDIKNIAKTNVTVEVSNSIDIDKILIIVAIVLILIFFAINKNARRKVKRKPRISEINIK